MLCIRSASPMPAAKRKKLGSCSIVQNALLPQAVWNLTCATSFAVGRSSGLGCRHCRMIAARNSGSPSSAGRSCSFAIKTPSGQLVLVYISSSTQPSAQMLLVAVWLSHLLPRSSGALHYKILTPSCIFLEYWVSEPAAMHGGAWILLQKRFVTALSEHMSAS